MPRTALSAAQRRHRQQLTTLLSSDDADIVYQGCELLTALQDEALITYFAEGSAFHDQEGVVAGDRIQSLVPADQRSTVALYLLLLLVALRRQPPPGVLRLRYAGIGPIGAHKLAACSRLAPRELDLRYNQLTDAGAVALAGAPWLSSVRVLHLQENQLGPDGIAALVASPGLGPLGVLDLRDNPIGEAGARAIAAAPQLARLEWLHLYIDDVGTEGAKALGASPHLPLAVCRYWRARA